MGILRFQGYLLFPSSDSPLLLWIQLFYEERLSEKVSEGKFACYSLWEENIVFTCISISQNSHMPTYRCKGACKLWFSASQ